MITKEYKFDHFYVIKCKTTHLILATGFEKYLIKEIFFFSLL